MCVEWTGKWRQTTRSIIAWKATESNRQSSIVPWLRDIQPWETQADKIRALSEQKRGSILHYHKNTTVTSEYPGIYLFRTKEAAQQHSLDVGGTNQIVKVRIPVGAHIRLGYYSKSKLTINATTIEVLT